MRFKERGALSGLLRATGSVATVSLAAIRIPALISDLICIFIFYVDADFHLLLLFCADQKDHIFHPGIIQESCHSLLHCVCALRLSELVRILGQILDHWCYNDGFC